MNKASEALISIAAIGEAVDTAQENVMESMKTLGHKCDVMQEYHLNVGSADEVIQEFLTNRDDIIMEYENEGPKKIYKKLLGMCNWALPHFNKLLKGIEDNTIRHFQIDNSGRSWIQLLFFGGPGETTINITMLKNTLKKTDKKSTRDAFSPDDRKILNELVDSLENWKRVSKYDRNDRKFFDRFIAYTRDTRTTDAIKAATKRVVDALEATRNMARSHFGGNEAIQEGSTPYAGKDLKDLTREQRVEEIKARRRVGNEKRAAEEEAKRNSPEAKAEAEKHEAIRQKVSEIRRQHGEAEAKKREEYNNRPDVKKYNEAREAIRIALKEHKPAPQWAFQYKKEFEAKNEKGGNE